MSNEQWFRRARELGFSFASEPGTPKDFLTDMATVLYMIEYQAWLDANARKNEEQKEEAPDE